MEAFCKSAWLGLNSYQESDSPRFFGRNEESDRLVEAISENGLCTVFGPSGAGKTSLLLAGVFPRLRRSDFFPVYLRFDHEKGAARYVRQVVDALDGAVQKAGFAIRETAPSVLPAADETLWEWFHRHLFLDDCLNPIRPVLMIDQFEEIFTKGLERRGAEEVQAFFTELTDLCTNNIPQTVVRTVEDGRGKLEFDHENCNWRLVVSLREDFLPRLEEVSHDHPVFRKMRQSVSSLTRDQALQAVRGPGGELVDETVSTAIVDAVGRSSSGQPGRVEPALLSLFCSRLDIARQQKGLERITTDLLAESEKDILADFYAETMGLVSEWSAILLEDRLLTECGFRDSWAEEDAKRAGVQTSEIEMLVNARLLRVDHRRGVNWLEFSHDVITTVAQTCRARRRQRRETETALAESVRQSARIRRNVGLFIAFFMPLFMSAVLFWFFFCHEYTSCYLRTIKVFGRIQGCGEPLSENDKRQVAVYFKLHKRGLYSFRPLAGVGHWFEASPVFRMEAFDGRGKPTTRHGVGTYLWDDEDLMPKRENGFNLPSDAWVTRMIGNAVRVLSSDEMRKVCAWEFEYGRDGRPLHEFGVDRDGNCVWGCTYASYGDADQWRSNAIVHFVDSRGLPLRQRADYVEITYDEKTGFEKRYVYYDSDGKIAKGKNGVQCLELIWNDRGVCTRRSSLGWSENGRLFTNVVDTTGKAGVQIECLSNDMVIVSRSFGLQGEACQTADGTYGCCRSYDGFSRLVRQQLFDLSGAEHADQSGFSKIECAYHENGLLKSRNMYIPANSFGVGGVSNLYCCSLSATDDGRRSVERYLDRQGHEIANQDGVSRIEAAYDADGIQTVVNLFSPNGGGGIWHYANVHHVERLYDGGGREISRRFFGVDGKLVSGQNNAHQICWEYMSSDEKCLMVVERYVDEKGCEVADRNGIARTVVERDADGAWTKVDLCAPVGRGGVWQFDSVHHVVRLYDAQGNDVDQRFFGVDGKPVAGNNNAHRTCRKYEMIAKKSLEISEWYFDDLGRETGDENGIARIEMTYDVNGTKIKVDLFAPKGRGGIWNYEKVSHVVRLYDMQGNEIDRRYYGVDGQPVSGCDVHCMCWQYAENGKLIGRKYLDVQMEPVRVVSIACVTEVLEGYSASNVGVRVGDVICGFKGSHLRDVCDFSRAKDSIREFAWKEKHLIVARKEGDGYGILAFDLPVGRMGVVIGDMEVREAEFDRFQLAYRDYLEKIK